MHSSSNIIVFQSKTKENDWSTVNDTVMGGVSRSKFSIAPSGYGIFSGSVCTEKNGGFAMVKCKLEQTSTDSKKTITMRIKGDAKRYQLGIKDCFSSTYRYVKSFQTSTDWESISIDLKEMYPSYRGRQLSNQNFTAATIDEISILIANKTNESFKLLIDTIQLI